MLIKSIQINYVILFIVILFFHHLPGQNTQFQTKLWKFESGGKVFASPLVYENVVYFGSSDGSFYAVDVKNGKQLWEFQTNDAVNSNAIIDQDMVFFGSCDGYYYALNCKNSSLQWKFKTGGEQKYDAWDYYLSAPVVHGDLVYFGSGDNHIYAVKKTNGELAWRYKTGGIVHTRGEIAGGKIYFGSFDGIMYSLDASTGELIWIFDTIGNRYFPKGEIQSSANVWNNMICFGSRDYIFYALNAEDGTGLWIEPTPSWIIAKPLVYDSTVYFGTSDGPRCYALDAVTGRKIWDYPILLNIFGSACIHKDEVFYPSFDGKIYVLDRKNGKLKYTIESDLAEKNYSNIFTEEGQIKKSILEKANQTGDFGKVYDLLHTLGSVLAAPVIADNVLYFTSTDGALYAYGY